MAAASDQQVQQFVNQRIRVLAEAVRRVKLSNDDTIGAIDDVYAALTQQSPTWTDTRDDAPPHLLTPADVLAINAFLHDLQTFIAGNGNYAIVLKACVQPVSPNQV